MRGGKAVAADLKCNLGIGGGRGRRHGIYLDLV